MIGRTKRKKLYSIPYSRKQSVRVKDRVRSGKGRENPSPSNRRGSRVKKKKKAQHRPNLSATWCETRNIKKFRDQDATNKKPQKKKKNTKTKKKEERKKKKRKETQKPKTGVENVWREVPKQE